MSILPTCVGAQIEGQLLTKIEDRRRPGGGWSYLVEELGAEGKRGRKGGKRFVVRADGSRRVLNELEKDILERESVVPRKRLVPK